MEAVHISRMLNNQSAFSHKDFSSLRAGDILVGKKVSKRGGVPLAVPGCAIVMSHELESTTCRVSWFTGPKSGRAESISTQDLQCDFDLLSSGDE